MIMKNIYQTPDFSIQLISNEDVITTSGDIHVNAGDIPGVPTGANPASRGNTNTVNWNDFI